MVVKSRTFTFMCLPFKTNCLGKSNFSCKSVTTFICTSGADFTSSLSKSGPVHRYLASIQPKWSAFSNSNWATSILVKWQETWHWHIYEVIGLGECKPIVSDVSLGTWSGPGVHLPRRLLILDGTWCGYDGGGNWERLSLNLSRGVNRIPGTNPVLRKPRELVPF